MFSRSTKLLQILSEKFSNSKEEISDCLLTCFRKKQKPSALNERQALNLPLSILCNKEGVHMLVCGEPCNPQDACITFF